MALTLGNKKLGKHFIYQFSIPPGLRFSCPGESPECAKYCYGKKGFYAFGRTVRRALIENYKISKLPNFAEWMQLEINRLDIRVFRIHVVGDYYSKDYIAKWIRIIKNSPNTYFFAYTRSWVLPKFRYYLYDLAELRNLKLYYSLDRSMSYPISKPDRVKLAYMQVDVKDIPDYQVDIIFRVQKVRKAIQKRVANVLVCPEENGITSTTCEKCAVCWLPENISSQEKKRLRFSLNMI